MPYATPADLLLRYDANDVGQLCSDNKRAVGSYDLATDPICLMAMNDASGDIDGALMVGNRYSSTDLTTLTPNSTYKLIRVCCDIAMAYLINRRPGWNPEKSKAIREQAEMHLERLRKGENTFNIQASLDAGEPVVDGPTCFDYSRLGGLRDRIRNFFPPRSIPKSIPPGV